MSPAAMRPLHVDPVLENKEQARLGNRLLRWVRRFVPLVSGPPVGRKSVKMQLSTRTCFPRELWTDIGREADITAILKIVQRELQWPNHYFAPDDPLMLVTTTGLDTFDGYALSAIEEKYGIRYSQQDLERITKEAWTLGQFVQDLMCRAQLTR